MSDPGLNQFIHRFIRVLWAFRHLSNRGGCACLHAWECRRRVDEFFKAGVTTTALQFTSFTRNPEERGPLFLKAVRDFADA